jgi:proteasome accessory factor B
VSAQKTERLLNLVICLLATRQFLGKEAIRDAVPQYAECRTDEAFERMFERDKEEVREVGIPLETGSNDAWFDDEVGYRVDRGTYALPEVTFEPDELAVLGLASRVWQQASLAGAASRALLKLKAAGVEPDEESLLGVEPRVRTSEPAFEPLYAAVRDRAPVTFPYRASRTGSLTERHLEPWGIVSWHGRWYVVGHDRDRRATRVFRLSRVVGGVRTIGEPGSVQVPSGVDFRAEVASQTDEVPNRSARLKVRVGSGIGLRRRATRAEPGDDGWDELELAFGDTEALAEAVAGYGPDAVALEPADLRESVVRRLQAVVSGADATGIAAAVPR